MSIIKWGCLVVGLLLLATGVATRPVEPAKDRFARVNQLAVVAAIVTGPARQ